jgi:DNA helicase HerA-like ATPase
MANDAASPPLPPAPLVPGAPPDGPAVGRIASVTGSQLVCVLATAAGQPAARLQKGALVKVWNDRNWVYGLVTGVAAPMPRPAADDDEIRLCEITMLGEQEADGDGRPALFRRGVSGFPTVGDRVFTTDAHDLALVYARPASGGVRIGTIHQDRSIPAYVSPDNLLGKHFAILGTTGTGKSCAAALLLHRITETHPDAHILLLDPHNEYAAAFGGRAEVIGAGTLSLPYWLFSFEELAAAVLQGGEADDMRQEAALLADLVVRAKALYPGNDRRAGQISVDTPVPYQMGHLMEAIDKEAGRLSSPEHIAPYQRLKARIDKLRWDPRYRFMFGGITVADTLAQVLSRLFRVPVAGRPITIVDLSAVPSEVLNIVVSVLARTTFNFALFGDRSLPVLLVCEEAHRYLPTDVRSGFEPTKRVLSRIAKEGRKYGVALGLISQRPADLAISALSQCNTFFALRLTNQHDQDFVRGAMPDWGEGLLDFLPSLRNAEAIVVGEGISVPARVCLDRLAEAERPESHTAEFSSAWGAVAAAGGAARATADEPLALLDGVIQRWRSQQ